MNKLTKKLIALTGGVIMSLTVAPFDMRIPTQVFANEIDSETRCASCFQPRYVSHKFTTKSRVYVGKETHTSTVAFNVGFTGRSDWGSIQIGVAHSTSRTFKKYKVVYDSTVTYDYYTSVGNFIRRETFNGKNLVRYEYVAE